MNAQTLIAAQTACDTADTAPIFALCSEFAGLHQGALDIVFHDGPMDWGFGLSTTTFGRARMTLGRQYGGWEKNVVIHRMAQILPLIKRVLELGVLPKPLHFSMSDGGPAHHVAFSSADGSILIPDCDFIYSQGWQEQRDAFQVQPLWSDRVDVPFWRGSSTGQREGPTFLALPRVRLCQLSQVEGYDMAMTSIVQAHGDEDVLLSSGLMSNPVPWQAHLHKRYNIDIDGNTCSWQGLFMKLLAGGVVIKVTSPFGYKQWYYNRLVPWQNFVPVRSDLGDLVEVVDRLRADDALAQEIARNGRALAMTMTLEREIDLSASELTLAVA